MRLQRSAVYNLLKILTAAILIAVIFSSVFCFGNNSVNNSFLANNSFSDSVAENVSSSGTIGANISTIDENIPEKKITANSDYKNNPAYDYRENYTQIKTAAQLKEFIEATAPTAPSENASQEEKDKYAVDLVKYNNAYLANDITGFWWFYYEDNNVFFDTNPSLAEGRSLYGNGYTVELNGGEIGSESSPLNYGWPYVTDGFSFFVSQNAGLISNVNFVVKNNIYVTIRSFDGNTNNIANFGTVVGKNSGSIFNCSLTVESKVKFISSVNRNVVNAGGFVGDSSQGTISGLSVTYKAGSGLYIDSTACASGGTIRMGGAIGYVNSTASNINNIKVFTDDANGAVYMSADSSESVSGKYIGGVIGYWGNDTLRLNGIINDTLFTYRYKGAAPTISYTLNCSSSISISDQNVQNIFYTRASKSLISYMQNNPYAKWGLTVKDSVIKLLSDYYTVSGFGTGSGSGADIVSSKTDGLNITFKTTAVGESGSYTNGNKVLVLGSSQKVLERIYTADGSLSNATETVNNGNNLNLFLTLYQQESESLAEKNIAVKDKIVYVTVDENATYLKNPSSGSNGHGLTLSFLQRGKAVRQNASKSFAFTGNSNANSLLSNYDFYNANGNLLSGFEKCVMADNGDGNYIQENLAYTGTYSAYVASSQNDYTFNGVSVDIDKSVFAYVDFNSTVIFADDIEKTTVTVSALTASDFTYSQGSTDSNGWRRGLDNISFKLSNTNAINSSTLYGIYYSYFNSDEINFVSFSELNSAGSVTINSGTIEISKLFFPGINGNNVNVVLGLGAKAGDRIYQIAEVGRVEILKIDSSSDDVGEVYLSGQTVNGEMYSLKTEDIVSFEKISSDTFNINYGSLNSLYFGYAKYSQDNAPTIDDGDFKKINLNSANSVTLADLGFTENTPEGKYYLAFYLQDELGNKGETSYLTVNFQFALPYFSVSSISASNNYYGTWTNQNVTLNIANKTLFGDSNITVQYYYRAAGSGELTWNLMPESGLIISDSANTSYEFRAVKSLGNINEYYIEYICPDTFEVKIDKRDLSSVFTGLSAYSVKDDGSKSLLNLTQAIIGNYSHYTTEWLNDSLQILMNLSNVSSSNLSPIYFEYSVGTGENLVWLTYDSEQGVFIDYDSNTSVVLRARNEAGSQEVLYFYTKVLKSLSDFKTELYRVNSSSSKISEGDLILNGESLNINISLYKSDFAINVPFDVTVSDNYNFSNILYQTTSLVPGSDKLLSSISVGQSEESDIVLSTSFNGYLYIRLFAVSGERIIPVRVKIDCSGQVALSNNITKISDNNNLTALSNKFGGKDVYYSDNNVLLVPELLNNGFNFYFIKYSINKVETLSESVTKTYSYYNRPINLGEGLYYISYTVNYKSGSDDSVLSGKDKEFYLIVDYNNGPEILITANNENGKYEIIGDEENAQWSSSSIYISIINSGLFYGSYTYSVSFEKDGESVSNLNFLNESFSGSSISVTKNSLEALNFSFKKDAQYNGVYKLTVNIRSALTGISTEYSYFVKTDFSEPSDINYDLYKTDNGTSSDYAEGGWSDESVRIQISLSSLNISGNTVSYSTDGGFNWNMLTKSGNFYNIDFTASGIYNVIIRNEAGNGTYNDSQTIIIKIDKELPSFVYHVIYDINNNNHYLYLKDTSLSGSTVGVTFGETALTSSDSDIPYYDYRYNITNLSENDSVTVSLSNSAGKTYSQSILAAKLKKIINISIEYITANNGNQIIYTQDFNTDKLVIKFYVSNALKDFASSIENALKSELGYSYDKSGNVGVYNIGFSISESDIRNLLNNSISGLNDYQLILSGTTFEILPLKIDVTFKESDKDYDGANISLSEYTEIAVNSSHSSAVQNLTDIQLSQIKEGLTFTIKKGSTVFDKISDSGEYDISILGILNDNYEIVNKYYKDSEGAIISGANSSKFTVNKAGLKVIINGELSKIYSESDPLFTYLILNNDTQSISSEILNSNDIQNSFAVSIIRSKGENAGKYNITVKVTYIGGGIQNFVVDTVLLNGSDIQAEIENNSFVFEEVFEIFKKQVLFELNENYVNLTYGEPFPSVTELFTVNTANVNISDLANILTGYSLKNSYNNYTISFNGGTSAVIAGSYQVFLNSVSTSNYDLVLIGSDTFTVSKRPLTIKFNKAFFEYGEYTYGSIMNSTDEFYDIVSGNIALMDFERANFKLVNFSFGENYVLTDLIPVSDNNTITVSFDGNYSVTVSKDSVNYFSGYFTFEVVKANILVTVPDILQEYNSRLTPATFVSTAKSNIQFTFTSDTIKSNLINLNLQQYLNFVFYNQGIPASSSSLDCGSYYITMSINNDIEGIGSYNFILNNNGNINVNIYRNDFYDDFASLFNGIDVGKISFYYGDFNSEEQIAEKLWNLAMPSINFSQSGFYINLSKSLNDITLFNDLYLGSANYVELSYTVNFTSDSNYSISGRNSFTFTGSLIILKSQKEVNFSSLNFMYGDATNESELKELLKQFLLSGQGYTVINNDSSQISGSYFIGISGGQTSSDSKLPELFIDELVYSLTDFDFKKVGVQQSIKISLSKNGIFNGYYTIPQNYSNLNVTINKRTLTLSYPYTVKQYDGANTITGIDITKLALVGVIENDNIILDTTVFLNSFILSGAAVGFQNLNIYLNSGTQSVLKGDDRNLYDLQILIYKDDLLYVTVLNAVEIVKRDISITFKDVLSKEYDGNNLIVIPQNKKLSDYIEIATSGISSSYISLSLSGSDLTVKFGDYNNSELFNIQLKVYYETVNAGMVKIIWELNSNFENVNILNSYTLNGQITARQIEISNLSKTYDSLYSNTIFSNGQIAEGFNFDITGFIDDNNLTSEEKNLVITAYFDSANVGGSNVTFNFRGSSNYVLDVLGSTTGQATINKRIARVDLTNVEKEYAGNNSKTALILNTDYTLTGILSVHNFTVILNLDTASVGENKTITIELSAVSSVLNCYELEVYFNGIKQTVTQSTESNKYTLDIGKTLKRKISVSGVFNTEYDGLKDFSIDKSFLYGILSEDINIIDSIKVSYGSVLIPSSYSGVNLTYTINYISNISQTEKTAFTNNYDTENLSADGFTLNVSNKKIYLTYFAPSNFTYGTNIDFSQYITLTDSQGAPFVINGDTYNNYSGIAKEDFGLSFAYASSQLPDYFSSSVMSDAGNYILRVASSGNKVSYFTLYNGSTSGSYFNFRYSILKTSVLNDVFDLFVPSYEGTLLTENNVFVYQEVLQKLSVPCSVTFNGERYIINISDISVFKIVNGNRINADLQFAQNNYNQFVATVQNAGNYVIEISVNSFSGTNYNKTKKEFTFSVAKKEITYLITNDIGAVSSEYSEDGIALYISGDTDYIESYKWEYTNLSSGNSGSSDQSKLTLLDVGEYLITLSVTLKNADDNYIVRILNNNYSFTVSTKKIAVSNFEISLLKMNDTVTESQTAIQSNILNYYSDYDYRSSVSYTLNYVFNDIISDLDYKFVFVDNSGNEIDTVRNAGIYNIKFVPMGSFADKYEIVGGNIVAVFTINKINLTNEMLFGEDYADGKISKVYKASVFTFNDLSEKGISDVINELKSSGVFTELTNNNVSELYNAGSYSIHLKITSSSNYNDFNSDINFEINPYTLYYNIYASSLNYTGLDLSGNITYSLKTGEGFENNIPYPSDTISPGIKIYNLLGEQTSLINQGDYKISIDLRSSNYRAVLLSGNIDEDGYFRISVGKSGITLNWIKRNFVFGQLLSSTSLINTFNISGLIGSDSVSLIIYMQDSNGINYPYSTDLNAGTYTMIISLAEGVSSNSNYTLMYGGVPVGSVSYNDVVIEKQNINITPSSYSKSFGSNDPDFVIHIRRGNFNITITLERQAGETVGIYDFIGIKNIDNDNFTASIINGEGKFSINKLKVEIEPNVYNKIYGESEGQIIGQKQLLLDNGYSYDLKYILTRQSGENVGAYSFISAEFFNESDKSNFDLVVVNGAGKFIINPRTVSLNYNNFTDEEKALFTKQYGYKDPNIVVNYYLDNGEKVTVKLIRNEGEDVKQYNFASYQILTYNSANIILNDNYKNFIFTITPQTLNLIYSGTTDLNNLYYNGTNFWDSLKSDFKLNGDTGLTLTDLTIYKDDNANISTYALQEVTTVTDAGVYYVSGKLSGANASNYTVNPFQIVVKKQILTIEISKTEYDYKNSKIDVEYNVLDNSGAVYNGNLIRSAQYFIENSEVVPVSVGTYTVVINVYNDNYEGNITSSINIVKAIASVNIDNLILNYREPITPYVDCDYNTYIKYFVKNGSNYQEIKYTPVDAGVYYMKAVIDDYNYKGESDFAELTINQISWEGLLQYESGVFDYNGEKQGNLVQVIPGTGLFNVYVNYYIVDAAGNKIAKIDGKIKDAGTYTIYAEIPETKNFYSYNLTSQLTINKVKAEVPSDMLILTTTSAIALEYIENAEYKIGDDGEWTTENIFNDLKANKKYTIYVRILGDDNHIESDVMAFVIKTQKTTIDYLLIIAIAIGATLLVILILLLIALVRRAQYKKKSKENKIEQKIHVTDAKKYKKDKKSRSALVVSKSEVPANKDMPVGVNRLISPPKEEKNFIVTVDRMYYGEGEISDPNEVHGKNKKRKAKIDKKRKTALVNDGSLSNAIDAKIVKSKKIKKTKKKDITSIHTDIVPVISKSVSVTEKPNDRFITSENKPEKIKEKKVKEKKIKPVKIKPEKIKKSKKQKDIKPQVIPEKSYQNLSQNNLVVPSATKQLGTGSNEKVAHTPISSQSGNNKPFVKPVYSGEVVKHTPIKVKSPNEVLSELEKDENNLSDKENKKIKDKAVKVKKEKPIKVKPEKIKKVKPEKVKKGKLAQEPLATVDNTAVKSTQREEYTRREVTTSSPIMPRGSVGSANGMLVRRSMPGESCRASRLPTNR